jgi:uncharacterized protein Veg
MLIYIWKEGDGLVERSTLKDIKRDIDTYVGKRIRLKANKGRKKTYVREGILEETYPNIFIISINDGLPSSRRISFSYADVLTETVEICLAEERKTANG